MLTKLLGKLLFRWKTRVWQRKNRLLAQENPQRRIIVVGSGIRTFRGYILKALHSAGFFVTLISDSALSWEAPYLEAHIKTPLDSVETVLSSLQPAGSGGNTPPQGQPFGGIFTYVEGNVPLTAKLSTQLGLHFYAPSQATLVRDKFAMRAVFKQAGLLVPRYELTTADGLEQAVRDVGTPCVIKPRSGEGSIGVIKVEDTGQSLSAALTVIGKAMGEQGWRYGTEFLVEEYVAGPEYSVESIVAQGRVLHAAITEKFKSQEPYFEEISHTVPAPLPPPQAEAILRTVTTALSALGINNCAAHTEIKLSPRGLVIIEVGGRLAGGCIPLLVGQATGINLPVLAAEAATLHPVHMQATVQRYASIGFFVPAKNQVIAKDLRATPRLEGLVEFLYWGKQGDSVLAPPDAFLTRLGYVIGVAETYEASRKLIEDARLWLTEQTGLELEPFPAGTPPLV